MAKNKYPNLKIINSDGKVVGSLNSRMFGFLSSLGIMSPIPDMPVNNLGERIQIGGPNTDGILTIYNSSGSVFEFVSRTNQFLISNSNGRKIKLNGNGGNIELMNGRSENDGRTVFIDGESGRLFLGGNGAEGRVVLNNGRGEENASISGGGEFIGRSMVVSDIDGSIELDGRLGSITAKFKDNEIHIDAPKGDISLSNSDIAEYFDLSDNCLHEPGFVMVIGDNGRLIPCQSAYDKKVAGIISGAGNYKPGIFLGKDFENSKNKIPIALNGKVYCKVDASYGEIEVGDLLTTSETIGHAKKATDFERAFGATIGKALASIHNRKGLVPVLVTLQ